MRFWRNWSRGDRFVAATGCIAVVIAVVFGVPQWISFVREDNAVTCYDARYWTCVRYQMAVRDELASGVGEETLDFEQILREAAAENFSYTLEEDLTSGDLCRQGGTCTFLIDDVTHGLTIVCDEEGHASCGDSELTEEDLDKVTW